MISLLHQVLGKNNTYSLLKINSSIFHLEFTVTLEGTVEYGICAFLYYLLGTIRVR